MPRGGTRQVRSFDMTRDGFTLLAMGFTGAKALKFKLAYIAEFNAMEEALKAPPPVSTEIAQLAATVAQMEERPRIARARR
ncbi:phage regulator Rha-like protein [Xanthobacter flavus]|nr:phage regulator Rha-like protein [Xanthobacter flavus]